MLPKANRFTFKTRIPKQILNSKVFSLRYDKNEEGLKVGVVVSKKVDRSAVVRNTIKRKILAAVAKNLDKSTGLTLVFYARKQIEGSDLAQEVADAIEKISGIKD